MDMCTHTQIQVYTHIHVPDTQIYVHTHTNTQQLCPVKHSTYIQIRTPNLNAGISGVE